MSITKESNGIVGGIKMCDDLKERSLKSMERENKSLQEVKGRIDQDEKD